MAYLIGYRIRVKDYPAWKANFDGSTPLRRKAGEKSYHLFRAATDPKDLTLLCEWDTAERAKRYLESPELAQAQQESGVTELPDCMVLELIERRGL